MITCADLDRFLDRLCDITVEQDPMQRAQEATALLKEIETVPQRFLMQWRAASVADAHYLGGKSMSSIAKELGYTPQTAINWLKVHGPENYLTVGYENDAATGGQRLVLRLARVGGETTRAMLRMLADEGRRIAPATMNLVDPACPGGMAEGIDAQQLWDSLA